MIVVIQCAARKRPDAGHLLTKDGRRVLFVAQPQLAPPCDAVIYARPDDKTDDGYTWRDELTRYNADTRNNPLGLLPAATLYTHTTYTHLSERIDSNRLFILSAGWGLLPASFLTPNYDITFSTQAEPYKRRRRTDLYRDFSRLSNDQYEPVVFFGGQDYAPLFADLTRMHVGPKTVFFNSQRPPTTPGCFVERFITTTRTNWHYECVEAWLSRL
jgi:hypothetical protein